MYMMFGGRCLDRSLIEKKIFNGFYFCTRYMYGGYSSRCLSISLNIGSWLLNIVCELVCNYIDFDQGFLLDACLHWILCVYLHVNYRVICLSSA
jgi:hypothetical protein